MKAQEATNARRPEKTFTTPAGPTRLAAGNRNPLATHAKTLVQVRLDPEAHHGDSGGEGEHAPPQALAPLAARGAPACLPF